MAPISKTELCFIFIMVGYAEFAHAQSRRRRDRRENLACKQQALND